MKKQQIMQIAQIAVLAGFAIFLVKKFSISDVAKEAGSAAAAAADGVISGAVESVGEIAGVPRTSTTECDLAKQEGRTWDASFACPAGDFIRYVFN